ncbi:MAG: heat-inducible transcriptional repressor HrcA [Peptoniphilaceae bacterium]|nr:heat-inducible transcriptional repressor HrcA [Peptoniphilaceae bacterium]MDY6019362.1 heat-inducible transcriptional repressor HrcA [Anaerococcus sp.]
MNERKKMILFSVINSYINAGEPIGSKSLASEYSLNISSATIRNEMSTLEKMGFLEKAHTSSGRLPSDKGYRAYVDYLLESDYESSIYSLIDIEKLEKELDKKYANVSNVVENATTILSKVTNLTAVSMTYKNNIKKLINLEIIKLDSKSLLFIAVYDNASIVNDRIYLNYDISDQELKIINEVLKKEIVGSNVNDISQKLKDLEDSILKAYSQLLNEMKNKIYNQSISDLTKEVVIKGIGNIFNFKEFEDDLSKAKEFIKIFDSKERIKDLMQDSSKDLRVTIGDENKISELKSSTIITSRFAYDNDTIGQIGIVGLTRIKYKQVLSSIRLISDLLSK